jgi:hypoxanthine-DNA glycosylase
MGFYYGHPQNVFWKTLAKVLGVVEPERNVEMRRKFLLENRIAVWDVLASCEIEGAADSSIKNPVGNDFGDLLVNSSVSVIFTTGKKATELFNELCAERAGMRAEYLPSTSPANRYLQGKPEFWEVWQRVGDIIEEKEV